MLESLTVLLLLQLLGEITVQLSGIPVPGPVVGMLILALLLCAPAGAFCTGSEYWVDGGAHIPGKFHWQTPHERN